MDLETAGPPPATAQKLYVIFKFLHMIPQSFQVFQDSCVDLYVP